MNFLNKPVALIVNLFKTFIEEVGNILIFAGNAVVWTFRPPFRFYLLIQAIDFIGFGSLFIILLTGSFTGGVFVLETFNAFRLFNAESLVGPSVAIAVARELGPVLTALMVTGRATSAIATEIGTMRVTEQIDALITMAVNPIQYLVVPRLIAGILMVPLLTGIFDLVGIIGGYFVGVHILNMDPGIYIEKTKWFLDIDDITHGLIKSAFFGFIITLIGCYKGFIAEGGAKGVGNATTRSVVIGCIMVFITDYILTAIMI